MAPHQLVWGCLLTNYHPLLYYCQIIQKTTKERAEKEKLMTIKIPTGEVVKSSLLAILAAIGVDLARGKSKETTLPHPNPPNLGAQKAKLLAFIKQLQEVSPKTASNLFRRYSERVNWKRCDYRPQDADMFAQTLASLLSSLENPQEQRGVFVWLGELDDENFNLVLNLLHHATFSSWIKNSWGWVSKNLDEFLKIISTPSEILTQKAEKAKQEAEAKRRKAGYKV